MAVGPSIPALTDGHPSDDAGTFQEDFQCPDDIGRAHQGVPDLFGRKVASAFRRYPEIGSERLVHDEPLQRPLVRASRG